MTIRTVEHPPVVILFCSRDWDVTDAVVVSPRQYRNRPVDSIFVGFARDCGIRDVACGQVVAVDYFDRGVIKVVVPFEATAGSGFQTLAWQLRVEVDRTRAVTSDIATTAVDKVVQSRPLSVGQVTACGVIDEDIVGRLRRFSGDVAVGSQVNMDVDPHPEKFAE